MRAETFSMPSLRAGSTRRPNGRRVLAELFEKRMLLSGTPTVLASGLDVPNQLKVDGSDLYFTNNSGPDAVLAKVPASGGTVSTVFSTSAIFDSGSYRGIANYFFDEANIYADKGGYVSSEVYRVPRSGGPLTTLAAFSGGSTLGIAGGDLYFGTGFNSLQSVPVGGGPPTLLASGYWARSAAIDDQAIYFTDYFSRDLKRFDLTTHAVTALITGNANEGGVFTDAGNAYIQVEHVIKKVAKVGGPVSTVLGSGILSSPATDGTNIYYVGMDNTISFVPVNGGTPTVLTSVPANNVLSLTVDNSRVYWNEVGIVTGGGPGSGRVLSISKYLDQAPTAADDSYAVAEDTPLSTAGGGVLANDFDVNGDAMSAVLVDTTTHGTLAFTEDGRFDYMPDEDFTGVDRFTYRASDGSEQSDLVTVLLTVTPAASGASQVPDPCGHGTATVVIGTAGADTISVTPLGATGGYKVFLNGVSLGQFNDDRIIIRTEEGDDRVQVAGTIGTPAWLFGESGNDRLNAGGGNSILVGGSGNDSMLGGGDRDILVGGQGSDRITGNADDDVLIAGYTDHDRNPAALCVVMDEWSRRDVSFASRVRHLNGTDATTPRSNGQVLLRKSTVHEDSSSDEIDLLTGSSGNDWYIYECGEDRVSGMSGSEANAVLIDFELEPRSGRKRISSPTADQKIQGSEYRAVAVPIYTHLPMVQRNLVR